MKHSRRSSVIPAIILLGLFYTYWSHAKYVLVAFVLLFAFRKMFKLSQWLYRIIQNLWLQDVDSMDGLAFEEYIARLLADHGYINVALTEQYDYGVDIIAEKNGIRWGIQVKRYSGLVKAEAVRQVVTGLRLYDCDRGMVITNSTFSKVAQRLASGNDCVLIDRTDLYNLAN